MNKVTIEQSGYDSVMIRYGSVASVETLELICSHAVCLRGLEGIVEVVESYVTLWVRYDHAVWRFDTLGKVIREKLRSVECNKRVKEGRVFEIEVDYSLGDDLQTVAQRCGLSVQDIVRLHTGVEYHIYAIGFLPGFAYMGFLDEQIVLPRKTTPSKVPPGAVAIAKDQTAIYPQKSLGGWYVLGVTDFRDFGNLRVGDRVRFVKKRG